MADDKVTIGIDTQYDDKGLKAAKKDLKETEEQAKKTGSAAKTAGEQGNAGFSSMAAGIGKIVGYIAAIKGVIDFFSSSVSAANENARAVNTLAAAYQAVGYTASGAMKQAQAFASKMQSLTGIADEAFLNAQRLLANYGVVGTKAQEAIQAAYALSIGKNMEFSAAMDLVSKAAVGQTQTLARYGIQIDKNTESGGKFDAVLAQINERFGATAQAAMGDSTTKLNALKESWGDFKEQVGAGLNEGLVPVVDFLTKAMGWLNKGFKSMSAVYGIYFDYMMVGLKALKAAFLTLGEYALKSLKPIVNVLGNIPVVGEKIKGVFDAANSELESMAKNAREETVIMAKMATPISDIWNTEKGITEEEEKQRALNEQKVNAQKKVVSLTKEELATIKKSREEEEKRVNKVLNNAGVGPKQTTSGWDTSSYVSKEQTSFADILAGTELNETEVFLQQIEERKAGLDDLYQKKLEILEQGHLDDQTFAEAKAELDRQMADQTATLEAQVADKRKKTMSNTLNALVSLQSSSNKKMAAVGKAAAITQATIDTYKSAVEAYSAMAGIPVVGPALAVAAAAAAIAAGLNNVAQISGVQLAEGGLVKAVTGGVPAVVGEGGSDEAVLPLDDTKAMRRIGGAIAEENGGAIGGVVVNINVAATGGVEAILEQLTDASRNGVVQALEFANLNYKVGAQQQGLSV